MFELILKNILKYEMELSTNKLLSEVTIKMLNRQQIFTVLDFVMEDPFKLTQTTNLDQKTITKLKNDFCCDLNAYNGFGMQKQIIKTGIESLDDLLGGGLKSGSLYDICGLSGSGKTQICNTITINLAIKYKYEVLYVDAKNDFSGQRIYNILKVRGCSDTECGTIMNSIRCQTIYNAQEFRNILRDLPDYLDKHERAKCLIVDSLPALWFPLTDGTHLLVDAVNLMQKIAFTHDVIFLLQNIVTRRTETNWDTSDRSNRFKTKETVAMGKYWHAIPRQRFLLSRTNTLNSQSTNQRIVKIIKGEGKGKSCNVGITNKGVV